jgi:choice-of-anchor A domain-containing protein
MNILARRVVWPVVVLAGLGAALAVSSASAQPAPTCPSDLCACLGAAGQFAIAGGTVKMIGGNTVDAGYATPFGSTVDDSVCATKATFSGIAGGTTDLAADVLLLTTGAKKIAGTFMGYKAYGMHYPGVSIAGDLVSAGGKLSGVPVNVDVTGATDTTGTNSKLAGCTQAMTDFATASTRFQGLTATQTLQPIKLKGVDGDINAAAGVNVINIDSIKLAPLVDRLYGSVSLTPSTLNINLLTTTDTVIINVAKSFSVGDQCFVTVIGGDPSHVIINMPGTAGSMIGKGATIDPLMLVPNAGISVGVGSFTGNLFGKSVSVKGADISTELACP